MKTALASRTLFRIILGNSLIIIALVLGASISAYGSDSGAGSDIFTFQDSGDRREDGSPIFVCKNEEGRLGFNRINMSNIKGERTGRLVNLECANLSEADVRGALLFGADLIQANLSGANLSGANLSGTNFDGADLSGANLREANFSGLDHRTEGRSVADLSVWEFFMTDLFAAILINAIISNEDRPRVDLSGANLRGADLRWADLVGVRYNNQTTMDDEQRSQLIKGGATFVD